VDAFGRYGLGKIDATTSLENDRLNLASGDKSLDLDQTSRLPSTS
jgi:hypothetical protein